MTDIKPCPFCGKTPDIQKSHGDFRIYCNQLRCAAAPYVDKGTLRAAIKAWNKRLGEERAENRGGKGED